MPHMKHRLKRQLTRGPLRHLAAPVYRALIATELGAVRLLDGAGPAPEQPEALSKLTAVIKTFERPTMARRLVASLRRRYPDLAIVVVDDSREPEPIAGVETVTLPFNSGLSRGRQAGLEAARTPYALVLDDDFIAHRATRLHLPLAVLERQGAVDLVAGRRLDLPLFDFKSPKGKIWPTQATPLLPLGSRIDGLEVVDKTPNCFVGRRKRLLEVGWDPKLRLLEHADWFTRALGKLVCLQDTRWSVLHGRTPFKQDYMRHREDVAEVYAYLQRKHAPGGRASDEARRG